MGKLTTEETKTLRRLAGGDSVVYSQDGDDGWFIEGDKAFVGNEIITLRNKGLIKRVVDDEENYRGMSERDVISDAGRQALYGALWVGQPMNLLRLPTIKTNLGLKL